MDKRLNLRAETKKLLKENRGTILFDISLGNIFWIYFLRQKQPKQRMELHRTKTFLHSKRNLQ